MTFSPSAAVINGVRANLPSSMSNVWVASKVQIERPARHIRVTRIGGKDQVEGVTDRARCLFECWSNDELDAEMIATKVHDLLSWLTGRWVTSIDENSHTVQIFVRRGKADTRPVRFDDESGQARFQFQGYLDLSLLPHS